MLFIYSVEPGSASEQALALLDTWSGTPATSNAA